MTPAEFWARVERDESGCWLWTGALDAGGYGRATVNGVQRGAHRHAYELVVGRVPTGLQLDHLCRVRRCVHPAHLEPVTCAENMRRAIPYMPRGTSHYLGRRSHCPRGHAFDDTNTRWTEEGRSCIACERLRALKVAS